MNALANISKEDLNHYLPRSLIDVLDDKDSCYSSPLSGKNFEEVPSTFTPSPQIPPLESRLHSYLLRKNVSEEPAKPCNLSAYFNEIKIENEIEKALKAMPHRVRIFEYLEENQFFEFVNNTILAYVDEVKPKLNAQAISFIPDFEKENICPKVLKKRS